MLLTYIFVKATAGSLTMISIGLIIASQNTSEAFNFSCSISLLDLIFDLPVNSRRRCALRRRMLSADVSGNANKKTMRIGPVIQTISQRPQRQPLACTAKPAMMGPIAGPQKQAAVHADRYTGSSRREYFPSLIRDSFARRIQGCLLDHLLKPLHLQGMGFQKTPSRISEPGARRNCPLPQLELTI
jgi:hypothetical protein